MRYHWPVRRHIRPFAIQIILEDGVNRPGFVEGFNSEIVKP